MLILKKYLLLLLVIFIPCIVSGQINAVVWEEDFETGSALNPAYWNYDLGDSGFGNNEIQNYTQSPENIWIDQGQLHIKAIKYGLSWTSARAKTQHKYLFYEGKIVVRAKIPEGSGTWPAIWLLGENIDTEGWPKCGELDIMEHVGKDPGVLHSAVHNLASSGNTANKGSQEVADFSSEFHDYTIERTDKKIIFSIDGNVHYTYEPVIYNTSTWPFDQGMFLILNIAMGGNWGSDPQYESNDKKNGIDPNLTSAQMDIAYIKYYQPIETIKIQGPNKVNNGKTIVLTTEKVEGASYTWELPDNAILLEGAGSNSIKVQWNREEDGTVKVKLESEGEALETEHAISKVFTPPSSPWLLEDFSTVDSCNSEETEGISFTVSEGALEVNVANQEMKDSVWFSIQFPQPVNLKEASALQASIKTKDWPEQQNVTFAYQDSEQYWTNGADLFVLSDLVTDNAYFSYKFDFDKQWHYEENGNSTPVDSSSVSGIRVLLTNEGGIEPGYFILTDLYAESELSQIPDRPTHLQLAYNTDQFELTWESDLSAYDQIEILSKKESETDFILESEIIPTNSMTFDHREGERLEFAVRGCKNGLCSTTTNTVLYDHFVTGNNRALGVDLYPNPASNKVIIETGNNIPTSVSLINNKGQTWNLPPVLKTEGRITVDLPKYIDSGIYYLTLKNDLQVQQFKVVLIR